MEFLGKHLGRKVYWLDYNADSFKNGIPDSNWIWFAIANSDPYQGQFDKLARTSIKNGLLEFKGQGKFGKTLHILFDTTMVNMEIEEGHDEITIMTTGDDETDLPNAFWECFCATCLPETTDYEKLNIICTNLDGVNEKARLKNLIDRFNESWIPEE